MPDKNNTDWGAIITTVASVVGSVVGYAADRKKAKEAAELLGKNGASGTKTFYANSQTIIQQQNENRRFWKAALNHKDDTTLGKAIFQFLTPLGYNFNKSVSDRPGSTNYDNPVTYPILTPTILSKFGKSDLLTKHKYIDYIDQARNQHYASQGSTSDDIVSNFTFGNPNGLIQGGFFSEFLGIDNLLHKVGINPNINTPVGTINLANITLMGGVGYVAINRKKIFR